MRTGREVIVTRKGYQRYEKVFIEWKSDETEEVCWINKRYVELCEQQTGLGYLDLEVESTIKLSTWGFEDIKETKKKAREKDKEYHKRNKQAGIEKRKGRGGTGRVTQKQLDIITEKTTSKK